MDANSRVSLSPTQPDPEEEEESNNPLARVLSTSSSSGSFLIRALPTIDSDSEFESDGQNSLSSYSSSETGDFVSGEEFETASEKPFDDETAVGGVVSGGGVKVYMRPVVADSDDNGFSSLGEEEEIEEDSVVASDVEADPGLEFERSRVMPIAHLSMDDDDFDGILESDAEDFGVARVPSFKGREKGPLKSTVDSGYEEAIEVKDFLDCSPVSFELVGEKKADLAFGESHVESLFMDTQETFFADKLKLDKSLDESVGTEMVQSDNSIEPRVVGTRTEVDGVGYEDAFDERIIETTLKDELVVLVGTSGCGVDREMLQTSIEELQLQELDQANAENEINGRNNEHDVHSVSWEESKAIGIDREMLQTSTEELQLQELDQANAENEINCRNNEHDVHSVSLEESKAIGIDREMLQTSTEELQLQELDQVNAENEINCRNNEHDVHSVSLKESKALGMDREMLQTSIKELQLQELDQANAENEINCRNNEHDAHSISLKESKALGMDREMLQTSTEELQLQELANVETEINCPNNEPDVHFASLKESKTRMDREMIQTSTEELQLQELDQANVENAINCQDHEHDDVHFVSLKESKALGMDREILQTSTEELQLQELDGADVLNAINCQNDEQDVHFVRLKESTALDQATVGTKFEELDILAKNVKNSPNNKHIDLNVVRESKFLNQGGEIKFEECKEVEAVACNTRNSKSHENDALDVRGSICVVHASDIEKSECRNEVEINTRDELQVEGKCMDNASERMKTRSKQNSEFCISCSTEVVDDYKPFASADELEADSQIEAIHDLVKVMKRFSFSDEDINSPVSGNLAKTIDEPTAELKIAVDGAEKDLLDSTVLANSEEEKEEMNEIQLLRGKFLRLVQRLGLSLDDSIVAKVLQRLDLASLKPQALTTESTKQNALQLESHDKNLSLNILLLGKTGVGKSATINSIFSEVKSQVCPFEPATSSLIEIEGHIDGVKIRILDTPGFRSSLTEEKTNRKILLSIKKRLRTFTPDVVLYVDRLDMHTTDLQLLRSLNTILSSLIWKNTILTLTHAAEAAAPPDESYGMFVAKRLNIMQHLIGKATGNSGLVIDSHRVALVDNQNSTLPNGQDWKSVLLLLCYSTKILALLEPQDPQMKRTQPFSSLPPLSHLMSNLSQSPKFLGDGKISSHTNEDGSCETIQVHLLEMVQPVSVNGDNPPSSRFLVRPIVGNNAITRTKLETRLVLRKDDVVYDGSGGIVKSNSHSACEANIEFRINQSTLGLSLSQSKWRGQLDYTGYVKSSFSIGNSSLMAVAFGVNNKRSRKITFKVSSSEYMQIVLCGVFPFALSLFTANSVNKT